MIWIVVAVIGAWVLVSAFVLVVICMNSSRISEDERNENTKKDE